MWKMQCNAGHETLYFSEMARQDTPQLLDPAIDHRHWSHLIAVQRAQLGTFRARTCGELLTVHDSFVERYEQCITIN
jgi:hypothetical protein